MRPLGPWAILLLVVCVSGSSVCSTAAAAAIRGMNPDLAQHYQPAADGTFTCIDGSNKIAFSRVNDNYCDCFDGSDEPGTSACYDGRFYCANRGDEPKLLAASFVDDGICDCCDGSDEPRGSCQNTCLDKSAVKVKELQERIEGYQQALARKAASVTSAQIRRDSWAIRKVTIDAELDAKQAEFQAATDAKVKADEAYQEIQRVKRKAQEEEWERQRLEREAEEKRQAEEAQAAADKEAAEQAAAEAAAQQAQAEAGGEQAPDQEQEESAEERGRRIASQWTTDPDAAAAGGQEGDEEFHEGYQQEEVEEEDTGYQPPPIHTTSHDPAEDAASNAMQDARLKMEAVEAELNALKNEKRDMDTYGLDSAHDFGPNNAFFPLAGKCFNEQGSRWNYEVCFYDSASQSESYTRANKVSLGTWKGFSADYSHALFGDGDVCEGTGPRSLRVNLVCGSDEQLADAREPSTCSYEVDFETPQACTDEEHNAVAAELAKLEEERRRIQAEIEAAQLHDEL